MARAKDHRKPVSGDQGIRFEAKCAADAEYVAEIPGLDRGWAGLNAEALEEIRDLLMSSLSSRSSCRRRKIVPPVPLNVRYPVVSVLL